MNNYRFVQSPEELVQCIVEFNQHPNLLREAVGNAPKYFVHVNLASVHKFGLSKFCAFNEISIEEYLTEFRYLRDGGTTQLHISKMTGYKWTHYNHASEEIKHHFPQWIHDFFPNYNLNNSYFITIDSNSRISKEIMNSRSNSLSLEGLLNKLKVQRDIGIIGENIALEYERNRLSKIGYGVSEFEVEQVSIKNTSLGYDIYSEARNEKRFIEVKSSMTNDEFYISANESKKLKLLKDEAFIYLVRVTNYERAEGFVLREIRNPIPIFEDDFIPILYKVKLV